MATIYILRHAESTANKDGILAGRIPGISLSKTGRAQSRLISKNLTKYELGPIYSSPLERCLETIEPFAQSQQKRIRKAPEFIEMDYGQWSGRKLSTLRREKLWRRIQQEPSRVRFPSGESFEEMQKRVRKGLDGLSRRHKTSKVLLVSHGDPIKVMIALTLGLDIDQFQKIVVDPGSLTVIDWPSKTLLGANIPLANLPKKNSARKIELKKRRVIGGGTNV